MMKKVVVFLLIAVALGNFSCVESEVVTNAGRYEANWESLDTRPMPGWFNEAKFGIFVVWGPYSVPAWVDRGYAEWYGFRMRQKGSATEKFHNRVYGEDFKYEQFAEMFTAELWDPDAWADLFVRSGAKYVVTTANYHDGFCLYPSEYDATVNTDKWNSTEVGPMRDLLGELNAAGRKRGLRMGIYYSLYEWYHPLWVTDRDRYVVEKFHPQFKEVVTKYKPPVIFLDGEWEMDYKKWRSEELAAWLFNDSPVADYIAINDRWGKCRGQHGSFYESEYGGGSGWIDHPWQEDRGIGHSYGYNRNETIDDYDSAEGLIRMLSRVCGNGGNYLLDVGPTADGRIPVIMQERLVQIGEWLAVNGDAIYGSTGSPFRPRKFEWGTCTVKPGKLYLHVWGLRSGEIELPGLTNKPKAVYMLADEGKQPLAVRHGEAGVSIGLPEELPDEGVSIIVVEIEGEAVVDTTIRQGRDGSVVLRAKEANIHGASPRYEGGKKDHIGYWGDAKDSVSWKFRIDEPGKFDVLLRYSCATGAGGSRFVVSVDGQKLDGETEETGAWDVHKSERIGTVKLAKKGEYTLRIQPSAEPAWKSMGANRVILRPAE
jgi:alpha-L-fucosidase